MIEAIITRLEERATELTSVSPAEALELIAKGTAPRNGAAFVLPFQDRPEPNPYATGDFSQRVEVLFLVVFVIRRQDDAKGSKRAGSFDLFKTSIEGALAGWSPDDANSDPCELAAGRSAPLGNGVTVYVQTWRTSRYIRGD